MKDDQKSELRAFFVVFLSDDRFIMKQMSRLELQSFMEFAPQYFQVSMFVRVPFIKMDWCNDLAVE